MTMMTKDDAEARRIRRSDYVSCTVAFIDCKKPGSHLKENYSIIGPGVTSSAEQVVNLPEPHGFNVGAAAMPNGITNNLHIHFTAEVFIVQKGEWTFRWGSSGEHELVGREGDIVSVPTWIFRGFTNTGPDDGWLFTVLGGDNTGGVIFHPDIIREAAEYGLYISNENTLIDASRGDVVPDESGRIPPMPDSDVEQLREVSPEDMRQRVVTESDRNFLPAFIDASLPGCGAQIAPVIGFGLTQNRRHVTPVCNPHGFSVEWMQMAAGTRVSPFSLPDKMVLVVRSGKARITFNNDADVTVELEAWETFSIPADVVRSFEAIGDDPVEMLVVVSGDHRKMPSFAPEVIKSARSAGQALDAGGFVAKASLLSNYRRAG